MDDHDQSVSVPAIEFRVSVRANRGWLSRYVLTKEMAFNVYDDMEAAPSAGEATFKVEIETGIAAPDIGSLTVLLNKPEIDQIRRLSQITAPKRQKGGFVFYMKKNFLAYEEQLHAAETEARLQAEEERRICAEAAAQVRALEAGRGV